MSTVVQFLQKAFDQKRQKNPLYSMRSFAMHLGIGSGRLSEFLSGQRQVSEMVALKIVKKLGLDDSDEHAFLNAVRSEEQGDIYGKVLVEDEFRFLLDPHYVALLSLIETKGFDQKTSTAAKRLGIDEEKVKEALQTLKKLSLIESKGDKYRPKLRKTQTTSDIHSEILKEGHKRRLKIIEGALDSVPLELRDSSSMILAMDPKKLPEAKDKLKKMRRRFSDYLETGDKSEVYLLAIHLVPMTLPAESLEKK